MARTQSQRSSLRYWTTSGCARTSTRGEALLDHRPAEAAQDRLGAGLHAPDPTGAAASGAGLEDLLVGAGPETLPRELEEAELADAPDLRARAVVRESRPKSLFDLAVAGRPHHVDEVADDDPAQVAQLDLTRDLGDRLEVRLERDVLEVVRVGARTTGVHVDGDERLLGLVEDHRAARGQVDPPREDALEVLLEAGVLEQRAIALVALDAVHVLRHQSLGEADHLLVDAEVVDDHLLRPAVEEVAQGPRRHVGLEVQRRGAAARGELLPEGLPETEQVVEVSLEVGLRAADSRGAHDHAHVLGRVHAREDSLEALALLLVRDLPADARPRHRRHEDEVAPGHRDVGRERRALVADRVLGDLDDDRVPPPSAADRWGGARAGFAARAGRAAPRPRPDLDPPERRDLGSFFLEAAFLEEAFFLDAFFFAAFFLDAFFAALPSPSPSSLDFLAVEVFFRERLRFLRAGAAPSDSPPSSAPPPSPSPSSETIREEVGRLRRVRSVRFLGVTDSPSSPSPSDGAGSGSGSRPNRGAEGASSASAGGPAPGSPSAASSAVCSAGSALPRRPPRVRLRRVRALGASSSSWSAGSPSSAGSDSSAGSGSAFFAVLRVLFRLLFSRGSSESSRLLDLVILVLEVVDVGDLLGDVVEGVRLLGPVGVVRARLVVDPRLEQVVDAEVVVAVDGEDVRRVQEPVAAPDRSR